MILIVTKKKKKCNGLFVNKINKLDNYIEGTFKKFPFTKLFPFPNPLTSHGLHYVLLISPDHSFFFFFFFSFRKFQRLINLQWLRCSLQSLFSSFSSSSSSFVFSLSHRLCFMPSSPSSFLFFSFCSFFFISSIEDPVAVIFLFKRGSPKCVLADSLISTEFTEIDGIARNTPE